MRFEDALQEGDSIAASQHSQFSPEAELINAGSDLLLLPHRSTRVSAPKGRHSKAQGKRGTSAALGGMCQTEKP